MRIHTWNVVFSLFFAALVFYGIWWLAASQLFFEIPNRDLFLITLAVFRLVRLFTYDVITAFIREWFVESQPNTFGHTLGTLLNCPWCTGLWFSFIIVFAYFATPFAWPVILVLAVAALASLVQVFANFIGWSAELKKREAQGTGTHTHTCGG